MKQEKPNVLVISVDSLRSDHLSCYGYGFPTTPNIDKLALESIVFKKAITNGGNTSLAFPPILASNFPLLYQNPYRFGGLKKDSILLSEVLKKEGYVTAGIIAGNSLIGAGLGYDKGFDFFKDFVPHKHQRRKVAKTGGLKEYIRKHSKSLFGISKSAYYKFMDNFNSLTFLYHRSKITNPPAEAVENLSVKWLSDNKKDEPFFLWLHYMDPHHPYNPPDNYLSPYLDEKITRFKRTILDLKMRKKPNSIDSKSIKQIIALYDGCVRYVDDSIGRLLEKLENLNMLENTLVVVTSDHGEAFREHGGFSHTQNLYEELLNVPLLIRFPGKKGKKIEEPVQLLNLAPTILDFLGIKKPSNYLGRSLMPLVKGRAEYSNEDIYSLILPPLKVSLRIDNYKYIYNVESGKREFYNLEKDKQEQDNIVKKHPLAKKFEKKIISFVKKVEQHKALPPAIFYDADIKDRLKALGYI